MSIEAAFYAKVKSISGITDLLGTSDNCRAYMGQAPQSATMPYAVYARISGAPLQHFGGAAAMERATLQVDCYDDDEPGAEALAEAFRNGFDGMKNKIWDASGANETLVRSVALVSRRTERELDLHGNQEGKRRVVLELSIAFKQTVPTPA